MLLDTAASDSIHSAPKKISEEKIVDVAEVNQWHCLDESGQWLENLDQTHLVLASGKLVLQKAKTEKNVPAPSGAETGLEYGNIRTGSESNPRPLAYGYFLSLAHRATKLHFT